MHFTNVIESITYNLVSQWLLTWSMYRWLTQTPPPNLISFILFQSQYSSHALTLKSLHTCIASSSNMVTISVCAHDPLMVLVYLYGE